MTKHLVDDRRIKLVQMLNLSGSIRVRELAHHFGVTMETIRKDLLALEQQGLLQKRHGGAIALHETLERPVDIRSEENFEAKTRIAMAAIGYLHDNMSIMIDSGSTLLRFVEMIPQDLKNLQIITNSFAAANILLQQEHQICFIGGKLSATTMATSGFLASSALNLLGADIAFLGSSGFQSFRGPTVKDDADAQVKKDMIKNARRCIVLADDSKFTSNGFVQYADWSDIDLLITNRDAPEEALRQIRSKTETALT